MTSLRAYTTLYYLLATQVYLLKAPPSESGYLGWTCGGAIVTPEYIITSAACVEDVKFMYAIAGYKKFIDASGIEFDDCTRTWKKKIVLTCVPKEYELEYAKIEKWAVSDIAVVQVESPYDFKDEGWKKHCSYIPEAIEINYEDNAQRPGMDAIVLGWGHRKKWRAMGDSKSYNVESLDYASTSILDKTKCKDHFKSTDSEADKKLFKVIDKYMICTLEHGRLDESGNLIQRSNPDNEGCEDEDDDSEKQTTTENTKTKDPMINDFGNITMTTKAQKKRANLELEEEEEEKEEEEEDYIEFDARKSGNRTFGQKNSSIPVSHRRSSTRRNGICQNDHGGPLITWVGRHTFLIGVASVFKVVDEECAGPYLFTSTQCNSAFLNCILAPIEAKNEAFRRNCDSPPDVRGFDMIERRISWVDHPAGPAENEIYQMRPQVPISQYY